MSSKLRLTRVAAGLVLFLVFALSLSILVPVYAQVTGATLSGTVKDQSGALVPDTQISISNTATGLTRSLVSDAAGFYLAPNLLPGTYEVTASAPGFATEVQTGITLTVGAQQVLNLTLRVGRTTEKVQVQGEAPAVQLATSSLSAVVNSTTVRELPLNGRSWTDLATLQPGVDAIQTQPAFSAGPDRGKRGFGAEVTVAGARPQQNNYRLDGISINDYDNGAPGSVLGGDLGVDAIQEFSVLTSNYSAEYGRTSGGVVNAVTRSGTNQFHGGVYEFLRNNALDARNFFDAAIPPFRRNQFGAEAGGPIRKDKVFVFGDYEGIRQSKGVTTVDTVPSVAARSGTLCSAPDSTPACTPTTITVDPSVQKYLSFWSPPNGGIQPGTDGDIGIFTFAGQQAISENFFTVRVDDKISDKDSLAATYLGDITPYTAPDNLDDVLNKTTSNRQIAVLEETHIFSPALVNSARIGYSRDGVLNNVGTVAINPLAQDPTLAGVPGQFASQVFVSGIATFTGGLRANGPGQFYWNTFQGYDDAFWTHGTHSLKFGAAVERMQLNMYQLSDSSGTFNFATLSDFLQNVPKRFTVAVSENPGRGLRQSLLGFYAQDDWRLRPNLTLNAGLRWEMTTVPAELQGRIATLINLTDPEPKCGRLVTGCATSGPLYSNPTLHNFDPRVGFAWDPFRDGKTAVRGGFGMFAVLPIINVFFPQTTVFPFQGTGFITNPGQGSFYTKAPGLLGPGSHEMNITEQNAHRSYVMQWNLNVQRELAPSLTALVGYVGSRGVHQPFRVDDLDIALPVARTPAGYLFTNPVGGDGSTFNPNFGDIGGVFYEGNSFYDALEVGIQKRMSHGVELQGSFTWGKSIDTGSATGIGDQFSNSIPSLPWYDLKSFRGLSDFNIGRTLVLSATWELPSPKSFSGAAGWLASGWELGGIYKANDGVPFTPTFGTDGDPQGLNSSDPWDFPNRLTGSGCGELVNPGNPNHYIKDGSLAGQPACFAVPTAPSAAFYTANCDSTMGTFPQCFNLRGNAGRNILIGPGISNLDFSVFKNNRVKRISENFNVQFRAEFFNVLNRANFAVPVTPDNTDIFDSTGASTGVAGLLTSTTTDSRQIQFAIKVVW
jgi:Carboxypeptidase regulatory-like domain/TonB dependent receptor-like, beta-barrel/TonB-dependent Receptor Plug Domain